MRTDGAADLLLFGALTAFRGLFLENRQFLFFLHRERKRRSRSLVRVQRKEREVTVRALWDTGNLLTDPATGLAVSVGEREAFISLFSESDGVLMIPYRTVGGNGLLEGRIADQLVFLDREGDGTWQKAGAGADRIKRGST